MSLHAHCSQLFTCDVLTARQCRHGNVQKPPDLTSSGELYAKNRPRTIVLDPDAAAVRLHGDSAEAQPEAAAVAMAAAGLALDRCILLENLFSHLLGHAAPAIAHGDLELGRRARRLDVDGAAR